MLFVMRYLSLSLLFVLLDNGKSYVQLLRVYDSDVTGVVGQIATLQCIFAG